MKKKDLLISFFANNYPFINNIFNDYYYKKIVLNLTN